MAKAEAEAEKGGEKGKGIGGEKEGQFLLGHPTFTPLGNGRFRCSETGHEMPAKDMESYGRSKRFRLALIDAALLQNKPPLNTFSQHPLSKLKLICKLTGDSINKSEEHIWKHINGKRFQNKLEQKEAENTKFGVVEREPKKSYEASKSQRTDVKKDVKSKVSCSKKFKDNGSDSDEPDFWMPPVGSRWDLDDGNDRWGSCTSFGHETDDDNGTDDADDNEGEGVMSEDLSVRTKRMSIAIGPSSFASRKKKTKTASGCDKKL